MRVIVLNLCRKEILSFPSKINQELLEITARLEAGITLRMPISKPMPSIGKHVFEIRLKDERGIYRVFYFLKKDEAIYLIHAFKKKTRKTPKKNINLVLKRIKRLK